MAACSNHQDPSFKFRLEHRPRRLKDFLIDDSNSCSSSGFKSFPRYPAVSLPIRTLMENDLKINLRKTPSKTSTLSAFQAMINAVRNIHFIAVKSPSILPRSLSRRLSSRRNSRKESHVAKQIETKVTVTIKDIIRWKSFRDLVEEKSPPLDSPPHHFTATVSSTASTTPCSSRRGNGSTSSWCDSDFTSSDYLPCWKGEEEVKVGKIYLPRVGEDLSEAEKEEERQQSTPVSVIDIEFEDDDDDEDEEEEESGSFERTKQKLMQKLQRFESLARLDPANLDEWMSMHENASSSDHEDTMKPKSSHEEELNEVEEKAMELLNRIEEICALEECSDDAVLLDLFKDEWSKKGYQNARNDIESEMLKRARDWIKGEHTKWDGMEQKDAYLNDIEQEGNWNVFEEDQQELALQIEHGVFTHLIDELLIDLIY